MKNHILKEVRKNKNLKVFLILKITFQEKKR